MEFFQESTFTAFLAIILTFIFAKLVSFAVASSNTDDNPVVCSINEGPAAKELTLIRGSRVKSAKNKKKVKFVDGDVAIRRVDRYEGFENHEFMDDVEKIVEEKGMDAKEEYGERVDQSGETGVNQDLGEKITEEYLFGRSQDKGSAKIEKETDDDNMDGAFSENHKTSGTSGLNSEISDEGENEVESEDDNILTYEEEGNGVVRSESDDDWEGIERSELEKAFAEAVNYLEYGGKGRDKRDDNKLGKLGSDVQLELYGLHKVAVEGPCHEPQPMALKVSARAKWNAWQKLGSMSRDAAMEQYIRVLSNNIPDWMHDYSANNDIRDSPNLETTCKISDPGFERKSELNDSPIGDSGEKDNTV